MNQKLFSELNQEYNNIKDTMYHRKAFSLELYQRELDIVHDMIVHIAKHLGLACNPMQTPVIRVDKKQEVKIENDIRLTIAVHLQRLGLKETYTSSQLFMDIAVAASKDFSSNKYTYDSAVESIHHPKGLKYVKSNLTLGVNMINKSGKTDKKVDAMSLTLNCVLLAYNVRNKYKYANILNIE